MRAVQSALSHGEALLPTMMDNQLFCPQYLLDAMCEALGKGKHTSPLELPWRAEGGNDAAPAVEDGKKKRKVAAAGAANKRARARGAAAAGTHEQGHDESAAMPHESAAMPVSDDEMPLV